jgi:hypothetical protein
VAANIRDHPVVKSARVFAANSFERMNYLV